MLKPSSDLTLRWVPGTFDRVRLECADTIAEVHVERVLRVLGREAAQDLYLAGRHERRVSGAVLPALLERLGCAPLTAPPAATARPLVAERGGFD